MSAKSEVCWREKITLSQQKVEESPRMEKSRCEGCVVGRKEKHLSAANRGQSTRMCQTVSRGRGIVPVSQPRVLNGVELELPPNASSPETKARLRGTHSVVGESCDHPDHSRQSAR